MAIDSLSVIVTNYNNDSFLRILVENLYHQLSDYPETEIIVVNDGSDKSCEWVKEYGMINIEKENGGVSSARNIGLENAHGSYISFIDSDDNVQTDYLHKSYEIMRQGYDYAIFPFVVEETGGIGGIRDELIGNNAVWAWCFRRSIIGKEKFNESLNVGEDREWLNRVIHKGMHFYRSDYPIYRYNWSANPNSLSKRHNRGELPRLKSDTSE